MKTRISKYCDAFDKRLKLIGIEVSKDNLIAGRARPLDCERKVINENDIGWDNGHFPFPFDFVIENGIGGVIKLASSNNATSDSDSDKEEFRQGIAKVYQRLSEHIYEHRIYANKLLLEDPSNQKLKRVIENLSVIEKEPPKTFEQGIQLFWFLWRSRADYHTSCIGRMDVFLAKLYKKSVVDEESKGEALALLIELFLKLNTVFSGDTLMNLMVGGVDQEGKDIDNELSILIMEATMRVAKSEPHINIRVHKNTTEEFLNTAYRLIAMGQGQGVLYNDEATIEALVSNGISLQNARCYANDGCTEITINSKSGIMFWQYEMVKTLELTLFNGKENPCRPYKKVKKWNRNMQAGYFNSNLILGYESGDILKCESFDEVYSCFLRQFKYQIGIILDAIDKKIYQDKNTNETVTSLLVSGGIKGAVMDGNDPLRGGFEVDNYQLLSGSIPTTADSLYAIKKIVFEDKAYSLAELMQAIKKDFEGYDELRQTLLKAPKFGNGIDEVDRLSARIVDEFLSEVEGYKGKSGVRILPGIYNIDFMMFASVIGATPDGRKAGDDICEHYSPTPGQAKCGPTAILRSAAKAQLNRGCAASPVYIAIPAQDKQRNILSIKSLVQGGIKLGLPLISFVVYDKEVLLDAMENPQKHADLVVRVWGYNARFIDLDEGLQRHIIKRIL